MNVLTTRTLSYLDAHREAKEVVLTVLEPSEGPEGQAWKVSVTCGPPILRRAMDAYGTTPLTAFIFALQLIRINIDASDLVNVLHWQSMPDCGLPTDAEKPASWVPPEISPPEKNPGDLKVFSSQPVAYLDETGVERESALISHEPEVDGCACASFVGTAPRGAGRFPW